MRLFVGTSGWMYGWNAGSSLNWYVENSKLNAIELNASFYRFPFPNQVRHWASAGKGLAWAVKVNRLITHQYKLSVNCYGTFGKFMKLFKPLDERIRYFLFQLPPLLTPALMDNVERFLGEFDIAGRFALEPRNAAWFTEEVCARCRKLGITLVSVDAPFARFVAKTSRDIYLRMHGRKDWYSYNYSAKELSGIYGSMLAEKPRNAFVFFNNDHDMLGNARLMMRLGGARGANT
jgi:uncharacterized protein YecE (DUF72 family)